MSKWNQQLKFTEKEEANGLPPHFLDAIVAAESADDPNAVSRAGAQGLFQFMPKTAEGYGIDPFNPEQAAGAAAKMYGELGKKYNHDLDKMLAGYNWGQGNVDKAIKAANEQGVDWHTKLPSETRNYIAKISKKLHGAVAIGAASAGDYADAADYASGTDSPALNEYSAKNRSKIGKPQNKGQDEEDEYSFLQEMMKENPIVGLFLMIFSMFSGGGLDFDHMNSLMKDFEKLPPEKQKAALDNLSHEDSAKFYSVKALTELSKNLTTNTAGEQAAELATRFMGQKEVGKNCGAIVQLSGVGQGQPWCGGFAHYIFSQTMPDVYHEKGENFNLAITYKTYGEKHGAFHTKGSDYTPEVGDAIVFSREGGNHVGIVTKIENGKVTYIAGNDGNKVDSNSFDAATPPANLLGFTSSRELAAAKHIDLAKQASVSEPTTSTNIQTSIIPKDVQLLANAVPKVNISEDKPAATNTPVNLASLGITTDATDTLYSSLPALVRKKSVNAIG